MRKLHNIIVLTTIVAVVVNTLIFGCSKKDEQPVSDPTYDITYTFTNSAPSYYVQIWDGTSFSDFADSIRVSPYTKTIRYNYPGTYRCRIDNGKNKVSDKSISITYNGATNTISDTLYPSLEYFISF